MKKKKWNYVREYFEEDFLGEKIPYWNHRFRFNEEKAEELVKVGPFEWRWSELSKEKRQILLKKIEPDGEDYRLKKDGQK